MPTHKSHSVSYIEKRVPVNLTTSHSHSVYTQYVAENSDVCGPTIQPQTSLHRWYPHTHLTFRPLSRGVGRIGRARTCAAAEEDRRRVEYHLRSSQNQKQQLYSLRSSRLGLAKGQLGRQKTLPKGLDTRRCMTKTTTKIVYALLLCGGTFSIGFLLYPGGFLSDVYKMSMASRKSLRFLHDVRTGFLQYFYRTSGQGVLSDS